MIIKAKCKSTNNFYNITDYQIVGNAIDSDISAGSVKIINLNESKCGGCRETYDAEPIEIVGPPPRGFIRVCIRYNGGQQVWLWDSVSETWSPVE